MPDTVVNAFVVCPIGIRNEPMILPATIVGPHRHSERALFEDKGDPLTPAQFYPALNLSNDGEYFWFKGQFTLAEQLAMARQSGVEVYTHKEMMALFKTELWSLE
jgi:hypothetical protein